MENEFKYLSDIMVVIVPIPSYRGYRVAICMSLLGEG